MTGRLSDIIDAFRRRAARPRGLAPVGPWEPIEADGASVLIVYLFPRLGDAVLLAPVVKALVDRGVAHPVHLLLRKSAARIWKCIDLPVRIHALPDDLAFPDEGGPPARKSVDTLATKLRRLRVDVAVDLTARQDVGGRQWVMRSEAGHRLGWMTDRETLASSGLTFGVRDDRHLAERHWARDLVRPLVPLGVAEPSFDIRFVVDDRAQESARSLSATRPRVLLVPGSASSNKQWPSDGFVEIGRFVVSHTPGAVVVAGSPSESKLVRSIAKAIGPRARAYAGKDLATLVALVEDAAAVVTNDTGPMHLAFLANVPTIAIFTWMPPVSWGPPRHDSRFVVLNLRDTRDDNLAAWTTLAIHHLEAHLRQSGCL